MARVLRFVDMHLRPALAYLERVARMQAISGTIEGASA
jgi:hypothetical protein